MNQSSCRSTTYPGSALFPFWNTRKLGTFIITVETRIPAWGLGYLVVEVVMLPLQ